MFSPLSMEYPEKTFDAWFGTDVKEDHKREQSRSHLPPTLPTSYSQLAFVDPDALNSRLQLQQAQVHQVQNHQAVNQAFVHPQPSFYQQSQTLKENLNSTFNNGLSSSFNQVSTSVHLPSQSQLQGAAGHAMSQTQAQRSTQNGAQAVTQEKLAMYAMKPRKQQRRSSVITSVQGFQTLQKHHLQGAFVQQENAHHVSYAATHTLGNSLNRSGAPSGENKYQVGAGHDRFQMTNPGYQTQATQELTDYSSYALTGGLTASGAYHTNATDFRQMVLNPPGINHRQRINSWTPQEEAFLIGVVVAKYLSQGSLFGNEQSTKKRKRAVTVGGGSELKTKTKSSAIEDCWISIKDAFDTVWKNYTAKTGFARPCERTSHALARHYKVMKTKLKTGKQQSFHELYQAWRREFNCNHSLLHPDYFAIQDHMNSKKVSKGHQYGDHTDHPMSEELHSAQSTPGSNHGEFDPTSGALVHSDQFQRVNSWNEHEEIILVGVVVDRFIKRGSLVSPRRAGPGAQAVENDCWSIIKRTYDLAWERFTHVSGIERPMERTVNALSRHYKVMRSRITSHMRLLLEKGQNSVTAAQEGRQNITLNQIYDTWLYTYNKDNILVDPNTN